MLLTMLVILSTQLLASSAPANFPTEQDQYIFIDFKKAHYSIKYDIKNSKAYAFTKIVFTQREVGIPLFDLVPNPISAVLNGEDVETQIVKSPAGVTSYRAILKRNKIGTHTLEIKNEITKGLKFKKGGVQSAFWMSDLSDRRYLEQYVPTNLEFDQYKITMDIKFIGAKTKQIIYTNAQITQTKDFSFHLDFPNYFTASSIFFHTVTEGRVLEKKYNYTSITGTKIPVTVYTNKSIWYGSSNLSQGVKKSKSVLIELEKKLGAWPHKNLIIYVAGQGGMEYSGATITSLSALGHEIIHSYFARGVMPIDGNSGWMDEAIASWRDGGYLSVSRPNFSSTSMAAHSQYRRTTDRRAYTQGANFMAYLNHNLSNLGGLIKFLNIIHTKYTHKTIDTEIFRSELELFSGLNFEKDFNKYIYGEGRSTSTKKIQTNPYHPILSEKQLMDLL